MRGACISVRMSRTKQNIFLFTGLIALLTLIYWHALRIPYFGDDFQWFFPKPSDMLFGNFFHRAPDNNWYRPLQSMVLAFIQMMWGADTLPIRVVHLLLQASIGVLIFRVLRYWKVSFASSLIAALYFAVSQAATFAVICNDTMSQMMGSLFGALTLWNLYLGMKHVREGSSFPNSRTALCLLTFLFSLVSKETSAGLCFGVFTLILVMEPRNEKNRIKRGKVATRVLPFFLVGLMYVAMRFSVGATMPSYGSNSSYELHLGFNILKNIGLFAFQSVLPFSSALLAHKLYDRNILALAGIVGVTAMLGTTLLYGIWRSPQRRLIFDILCFALFAITPAIFLNHVSEVYLFNALPYVAVAFGFAIEYYWKESARAVRISFSALLTIVFIANIVGAVQKTASLAEESSRSQVLMQQIYPIVSKLPNNGRLYLVNPVTYEFEYSVFAMKGFNVVKYADPWILRHTDRPDASIYVLDSAEYRDSTAFHPGATYTLDMKNLQLKPF
jgi:hypothetical protein